MSNPSRLVALLSALVLGVNALLVAAPANAVSVWGEDWQTNGDATVIDSSHIVLTPNAQDQVGSAWVTTPLTVNDDSAFSVSFKFRISGSGVNGDGMAFVMHDGDTDALGGNGSDLGYNGIVGNLLAVEFDTFSFDDETPAPHVAIQPPGSVLGTHPLERFAAYTPLVDTDLFAWIDFDPVTKKLSVFLDDVNVKPPVPLLYYTLASGLETLIGPEIIFGFTAGTGIFDSRHEVLDFSITTVPLPAAAWLLLSGLAGLGFVGRRRTMA